MSPKRLQSGGLIDRATPLNFTFDGKAHTGFEGDTLASALLGAGVSLVGRSFKYHRPRGVWGGWSDDPNAIFDVALNGVTKPNVPGASTYLEDGMALRSVNAFPSAQFDLKAGLDLVSPFLPAGFYYKMFMWPDWHLFEPAIRKMAGLGRVQDDTAKNRDSLITTDTCDMLIIGAGPAGLSMARAAAIAGQDVVLVEDHRDLGGSLLDDPVDVDGMTSTDWIAKQTKLITNAGGHIMRRTTAYGIYDHGLVALYEDTGFTTPPKLHRLRAKRIVLATGALDRPVVFANNDRPGVMSLSGAASYLNRYGVRVGKNISIVATPQKAKAKSAMFEAAGAQLRYIAPNADNLEAMGRKRLNSLRYTSGAHPTDAALCSAGQTPLIHLWCHQGGRLIWDETRAAFVPGDGPDHIAVIGAARGVTTVEACLTDGEAVAAGTSPPLLENVTPSSNWPRKSNTRQWIDFQSDVTLKDVELAARENFASVEHLKRYTTLGMATDQGKTSNINGLAALAGESGKTIPEVGTTKFRPPYVPVPLQLYHGARSTTQIAPLKRSVLEPQIRALGAAMAEYGGWLRPAWYGEDMASAVRTECLRTRQAGGIIDASSLGKIEVIGPDAEAFLNFVYYNTISTLKPGHVRYGFLLTERGIIYDDGVVNRLNDNHFVVSSSSSHVQGVTDLLEAWRQDGNDPDRVFVHDVTHHWATVTIAGPKARDITSALKLGVDLSAEAFPHMSLKTGTYEGEIARIARVSFTGELSYEISVPRSVAPALWEQSLDAAKPLGAGPLGMEASSILRAEKGYIIIGKDTDGNSIPPDLGVTAPRDRKTAAYVGDRGLKMAVSTDKMRQELVGLEVEGTEILPTGAHIVDAQNTSLGYVTSSYDSPTLGRPIALALMRGGTDQIGNHVDLVHMGTRLTAKVTPPCAFDPKGERLNA